ncbi:MAG TPA: undecaprenyl-diphosphate phosphatase [Gammaproteobacteria bacterium]|nr:undecaprenyl-diphosphate phosphatase [Gammaproteobacteria bacterium]
MTEWHSSLILGAIQGFIEFLPISSSAHLILVPKIVHWADQGIAFDIAVHVGTLFALITYFRHMLFQMTKDFFAVLRGQSQTMHSLLAWQCILATIPVGLFGWLFHDFVATHLRSGFIIGLTTLGFGILLGLSDVSWLRKSQEKTPLTWKKAMLIGLAQILSLIPGTSRSGITMTAALALGLSRAQAALFSFFLAIPVIVLAGGYEGYHLLKTPSPLAWGPIAFGACISFVSAYLCIHTFLKFVEKIGMLPFAVYRVILGCFLLVYFL